jgi:hypothetical protein
MPGLELKGSKRVPIADTVCRRLSQSETQALLTFQRHDRDACRCRTMMVMLVTAPSFPHCASKLTGSSLFPGTLLQRLP